ncbi:MAG: hypothetical protein KDE09_25455, partial [Anaerolineales bacterium]|nr:hypothetical protein [Anaerolineales bacterium]
RSSLASSLNISALKVTRWVGEGKLLRTLRRLGLTSLSKKEEFYGLGLVLGNGETTLLQLATAYMALARGGEYIAPRLVLERQTVDGGRFRTKLGPRRRICDERVAYLISDILDDDAARIPAMGRDNPLALPFPAAAKTGTSNDFRDNWTVGYTPGLVVGVWAGNTDNSPMVDISGLTGAAPLWSAFVQGVYGSYELLDTLASDGAQPPTEFVAPAGLESRPLCDLRAVVPGATECQR